MGDHWPDNTLNKAKEMDISQRIQDVAKKLCVRDGLLWEPIIDANKPGGLTDDEKKQLTLQQEESAINQKCFITTVQDMYDRLSSIDYTITTK